MNKYAQVYINQLNSKVKSAGVWDTTKDIAKAVFVDPVVDTYTNSVDAYNLASKGDYWGASGKGLKALGNAGLAAMTLVPGVGLGGKLLGAGIKGLAGGSKALGATRAASTLGKIEKGVVGASQLPARALGDGLIAKGLAGTKPLVNTAAGAGMKKHMLAGVTNIGVPLATQQGLDIGGQAMYDSSTTAKTDNLLANKKFQKIVGPKILTQIQDMPTSERAKLLAKMNEQTSMMDKIK
jgi:hypothetical protein